jgi:hypothetical protein
MIGKEVAMDRFGLLLAVGLLLAPFGVGATQQGQSAMRSWKAMDNCARQAQTAYPDFSPEANAKRDAKLKECLSGNGLPPREPSGQPGPR